jgi:hypothetical protein
MASIFSGLFGGAGQASSSSSVGSQYVNTLTTTTGTSASSLTGLGAGMGIGGVYPVPPTIQTAITNNAYQALNTLEQYMELCGDKLEYIRLSNNIETSDPKVSMLKLLKAGEFLKNVGLKYDDNTYYVIREQE